MNMIIFSELVSSNNFYLLLLRSLRLFIPNKGLGIYLQGVPTANVTDFFWGTNAGIRTLPLLSLLTALQKFFGSNWDIVFLILSVTLPFLLFLLSVRLLGRITLFSLIGAIFYGGNLWITNRLYSGFWQLNIAYAFLPFLVTIPIKILGVKKLSKRNILFWAISYALLASSIAISQPHFLIITSLFSFLHILYILIKRRVLDLKKLVLFYLLASIIFLIFNSYFLIPSILYPEISFTAPNQYFSLAAVIFNGQGNLIEHVLRFDPLGFSVAKFSWGWIEYLQLIPILFVGVLFALNKKRNYIYLLLVLIFLFLAKGINHPALMLSKWIYQNIFFMHYFRDPSRFLSGVALFSSLSISEFTIRKNLRKETKQLIVLLSVLFFITINSNLLKPPKTDLLAKTNVPMSYLNLQEYINKNLSNDHNARLLILPNQHGMAGYPWYTDKNPNPSNTIFDDILPLSISLADTTNFPDTPSSQVSSFIYSTFTQTYDSKILMPLGVKYILIDSSINKPDTEKEIASTAKNKLSNDKKEYTLIFQKDPLSLFKINNPSSLVSNNEPVFAIGDLGTVAKNYATGSMRPVILLNQYPNSQKFDAYNASLSGKQIYIDLKNPEIVLTSEILSDKYSLDILKAAWDYDKIFVNNEPYKMKYISTNGALFTSGQSVTSENLQGSMNIRKDLSKGRYHLLIKALTQTESALGIKIGNEDKKLHFNTNGKLVWIDEGTVDLKNQTEEVSFTKTDNNFVTIDQLIIVPENIYQNELTKVRSTIRSMTTESQLNSENESHSGFSIKPATVVLNGPSHYLTYRTSYGKYWKADVNAEKFMSDGYGMTFINSGKKIKKITYFPDTVYKLSIVISALSAVVAIIYLGVYIKSNKSLLFDKSK